MGYYNLDQNMCNDKFAAIKKTKKDQVAFRKHFGKHFYAIQKIQKLLDSFPAVFSGELLRNASRSRNRIQPEYYLTLFQIVLLLCIISNTINMVFMVFIVKDSHIVNRISGCTEIIDMMKFQVKASNELPNLTLEK